MKFDGLGIQDPEKVFSTVPTLETIKENIVTEARHKVEEAIQDMTNAINELASNVPMHFFGTKEELDAAIEDLPVGTIVFCPDDEGNS